VRLIGYQPATHPLDESHPRAGKKSVTQWSAGDIDWAPDSARTELAGVYAPQQTERKHIIIEGDGQEEVSRLRDYLTNALS
jgi:electron transfer flavoprotein alpha/beta subunit